MSHAHHHHAPASYGRAFALGIGLNLLFVVGEFIAGSLSGSLALIADAGHNFSDVFSLVLAWAAALLSRRAPSGRFTYGWRRSSIWAAVANALLLYVALGGIGWEALRRISQPLAVEGITVALVALVGVGVNAFTAWLFVAGSQRDLNMRAAFVHLAADAALSLGVVVAGLVIAFTGWAWIDPIVSLVLVALIAVAGWNVLAEAIRLSLDAAPAQVNVQQVRQALLALPEIANVHDLHIWALSTNEIALTAHVVTSSDGPHPSLLRQAQVLLHDTYGIEHATLQLETGGFAQECAAECCA